MHEIEIFDIVAKQASVERDVLKRETRLSELNLQSIDIVELIFAIEDKFDITIPYANPTDMNAAGVSFDTVGGLTDAVEKLIAEQHAPAA